MSEDQLSTATIRLTGRVAVFAADDRSRYKLTQVVQQLGFEATPCGSIVELQQLLATEVFPACVVDEPRSLELIAQLESAARQANRPTHFIVLPPPGQRLAGGGVSPACEILDPPHTSEKLGRSLFAAVGRARLLLENLQLRRRLEGRLADEILGNSPAIQKLRTQIRELGDHGRPALICGEPGTGTNVVARAVHAARYSTEKPLIRIRCSVLSAAALELELFGEVDGDGERTGRIAQAAGGTLLLDDIDAVAAPLQEQLARMLASGSYRPGNGQQSLPLEARIVATTHVSANGLSAGRLLSSLDEQFAGAVVTLTPLRERSEDVVPLAEHFLAECAAREGQTIKRLTVDAVERLKAHAWPGNVRELANVMSRCCTLDQNPELTAAMLEPWLEQSLTDETDMPGLTLREMERKLIEATFNRFGGNRELTAKALQIGLRTLSGKLREYGYPPRGGPGSNRVSKVA